MRRLVLIAALLLAGPARPAVAQVSMPAVGAVVACGEGQVLASAGGKIGCADLLPLITAAQAKADAAVSAVASACQPASTVPPMEAVGGAPGTSGACRRADAVQPRISRTGSCVLSAANTCTAPWTSAFAAGVTPVMLGDPVAINTGASQPIDCDVTGAPTITGVPVKCWVAKSSALTLSALTAGTVSILPFDATSLASTTVTVAAIPASS